MELQKLIQLGVFRAAEAREAGVSQPTLSRLTAAGKIERVGPGLYLHPAAPINPEERDFAVACARFGPESVIGGLTALFHYGLIEQVPNRIWVLVPYASRSNDPLYRCIRTKTNLHEGVEVRRYHRISNLERTLVEAFRYASKIGLRVAIHATRRALAEKRTTLQNIHKQAKRLQLESHVEKHWEAIVPDGDFL